MRKSFYSITIHSVHSIKARLWPARLQILQVLHYNIYVAFKDTV